MSDPQPQLLRSLDEQRAEYARRRGLAMPLAGSIVWTLLGLHTVHIVTDVADTLVLAVLMFTRHAENHMRLSDVTDNVFYWNFVVLSWIPIYLLLYWFPRW